MSQLQRDNLLSPIHPSLAPARELCFCSISRSGHGIPPALSTTSSFPIAVLTALLISVTMWRSVNRGLRRMLTTFRAPTRLTTLPRSIKPFTASFRLFISLTLRFSRRTWTATSTRLASGLTLWPCPLSRSLDFFLWFSGHFVLLTLTPSSGARAPFPVCPSRLTGAPMTFGSKYLYQCFHCLLTTNESCFAMVTLPEEARKWFCRTWRIRKAETKKWVETLLSKTN